MRTVVTGGSGFIGSHLVDRLINDGHEVTVLDDYSRGRPVNLQHLKDNPRLTVHTVDVANYSEIEPYFSESQWVFHLAGLADIVGSIETPLKYFQANVASTVSALEAARNFGASRFVYAASSSCYGVPDNYPTPETAPIRTMFPYALTKYLGEQSVMHWNQVYGLPCVSLRLFNVYGPRALTTGTYGAVFGVFLAQKLSGQSMTIVGDGNQTRDFTFVTDVVDCFVKAAQSDISGECLNVGSGNTYSINKVVDLLGGASTYIPRRPGEPECTFADIARVQRLLGWQPAVKLEDGIRVMLENIEQWREAPVWNPESISEATQSWFKYLSSPAP